MMREMWLQYADIPGRIPCLAHTWLHPERNTSYIHVRPDSTYEDPIASARNHKMILQAICPLGSLACLDYQFLDEQATLEEQRNY